MPMSVQAGLGRDKVSNSDGKPFNGITKMLAQSEFIIQKSLFAPIGFFDEVSVWDHLDGSYIALCKPLASLRDT